ncbi:MAG: ssDNA-binding domain-containing protein [Clostridiales bacterium]|nr:ssDNA-binding domain-containing protein [Clostridiales bacterium]
MNDKRQLLQQIKDITEKLENGTRDIFTNGRYEQYLKTMSKFHKYSTHNTMLIHMSNENSTMVAGFTTWQLKFDRHVRKGEKAIKIFAPITVTSVKKVLKIDPKTKKAVLKDGFPVYEEIEVKIPKFKVVSVFDISQTEGKPLPLLTESLTGDVKDYDLLMEALKMVSKYPIIYEDLDPGTDGLYYFDNRICIRRGMSETQTVSAVVHELAHSFLHTAQELAQGASLAAIKTAEVEAESVSYTVCQYFDIETSRNSFGYLAEWSRSKELKELTSSLETIRKTSSMLIESIESALEEAGRRRGNYDRAERAMAKRSLFSLLMESLDDQEECS